MRGRIRKREGDRKAEIDEEKKRKKRQFKKEKECEDGMR